MATLLLRRIVKKKNTHTHNIKGEAEGNKLLCAHSSGEFKDVTLNPFGFWRTGSILPQQKQLTASTVAYVRFYMFLILTF